MHKRLNRYGILHHARAALCTLAGVQSECTFSFSLDQPQLVNSLYGMDCESAIFIPNVHH